jgi:hypothetical protein
MSKILQRLNVLVISLLALVLTSVLVAQIKPGVRPTAQAGSPDEEGVWPKTLEVSPSEPGDPVRLVRILKGGEEIVPGTYILPEVSAPIGGNLVNLLDGWQKDMSIVLENDSSKDIISVGIGIVFPARDTSIECSDMTGNKSPHEPWCEAHPHWCDGGCPSLMEDSLHWGRVPVDTAKALQARYSAEGRGEVTYPEPWTMPLQGKDSLRLTPGSRIALSPADAGRSPAVTDPRHHFHGNVDMLLDREGLEKAEGTTESLISRAHSKFGWAYRAVPKFNVGIVVVYFDDGSIWGNFGFGYGVPNPDGIFSRVTESELALWRAQHDPLGN